MAILKRYGKLRGALNRYIPVPFGIAAHSPLFKGTNELIAEENFVSAYEGYTAHSKNWTHEAILYGASAEQALEFYRKLRSRLANGPSTEEYSYQAAFTELFNEISSEIFPKSELHSPAYRIHELKPNEADFSHEQEGIRAAVEYAFKSEAPVVFHYDSERVARRGALERQDRVRRANVRSVHDEWFSVEHANGIQNFSFHKVHAASVESAAKLVGFEPVVRLVITSLGLGNRFELNLQAQGKNLRSFSIENGKLVSK